MAPFLAKAGHSLQVPGKSGILADHDKRRRHLPMRLHPTEFPQARNSQPNLPTFITGRCQTNADTQAPQNLTNHR